MAGGNATKVIVVDSPANAEKVVFRTFGGVAEKVIEVTSGLATKVCVVSGGVATPVQFIPPDGFVFLLGADGAGLLGAGDVSLLGQN